MRRGILLAILVSVILGAVLPLHGQTLASAKSAPARLDVMLAYNAVRSGGSAAACDCFWMQGGKVEFNAPFTRSFSLVGEVAAQHVNSINSANQDFGLVTFLAGPRISFRRSPRITPFGQVLVGGVHGFAGYFPGPNGTAITPEAFAMAAGGGLNIYASHHIAIRPVQADYLLTQLPNAAGNQENSLRLAAGIVFMIGSWR